MHRAWLHGECFRWVGVLYSIVLARPPCGCHLLGQFPTRQAWDETDSGLAARVRVLHAFVRALLGFVGLERKRVCVGGWDGGRLAATAVPLPAAAASLSYVSKHHASTEVLHLGCEHGRCYAPLCACVLRVLRVGCALCVCWTWLCA